MKGKKVIKNSLPHYKYAKWLEMRKKTEDIDKNRNQIRAISKFLQSIIHLPATSDTVAVPQHQI